ncbi:hypothetical protein O0L34_g4655 [Tuta absoluta]|nr:hypothetical protein O0L34_g4655 [Tuta absoluta]
MYLLLAVALLGSAFGIPLTAKNEIAATNEELSAQYVLPGESYPTFYDVQLYLDPDNMESFNGTVNIRVLARYPTNQLVLHAMEMEIGQVSVERESTGENIFESFELASDDTHFLKLNVNTTITILEPYVIKIDFKGQYADNMFGIYRSTYTENNLNVNLITSQLQPTFARRAFPCYDEPHQKAVFRTTIYAPPSYATVRSNMPLRNDTLKPEVPGFAKHEFQDTLSMSTYLHAYLVSNFDHISNEQSPIYEVPFKVFSRPGTQENAKFALDFGQRNMMALENYTEMAYAFPKIDKAAVPDFNAGAMENWGLVIYREVALLVTEGVTTTQIRQNIARIISHENTHMWFGNEVSPLSWTYTWLNEGFANFFENFGTDLVLPNYRMMDQYVLILQGVMQNDAVLSVNPMTYAVFTPSQIIGTFNAVAYQKSGSVIRMMQHFLTPEVFRKGLALYIKNNARNAAAPSDLYVALQQALDESNHSIPYTLSTILTRWTTQGGFPVLNVVRSAPTAESIIVSQERFLTDSTLSSTDRWHVPINWVLSTNIDFSDTSPQDWIPPSFPAESVNIPGLSQAEWFIVNKQQTGYYRVNYDESNWAALAKKLATEHLDIHVLNRAQIVDDSFNLARNGRLNYTLPFEISRYLVNEKDYVPWGSVNNAFNYLNVVLSGTSVYELFQKYMLELSAPLFNELGFEVIPGEEFVTPFHRNIILNMNCQHGNQACVDQAQQLLQNFRENPNNRLNPDIQNTVFCSGLRGGDRDSFNFLWELYQNSTDASEQSILLSSMGCTPDEELLDFFLKQVIDDASPVREQDKHSVIVAVINSSPRNMDIALDFVLENFDKIQPRVQGLTGTTNILNAFARGLNSQEHSGKINQFEARYTSIFSAGELAAVAAIKENIDASITWTNKNLATVDAWLQANYGESEPDSANAVTSTLVVFLSVFCAYLYR